MLIANLVDKIEKATAKAGGKYPMTVLLQKRIIELTRGAQKLVDVPGSNPIEIALEEIIQEKIKLVEKANIQ